MEDIHLVRILAVQNFSRYEMRNCKFFDSQKKKKSTALVGFVPLGKALSQTCEVCRTCVADNTD